MAIPQQQGLDGDFVRRMSQLKIDVDPSTAVSAGRNRVEVQATVTGPDGKPGRWSILLARTRDGYAILATTKADR